MVLLVALLLSQDSPEKLLEQFRSDSIEVRETAARKLIDSGRAVRPLLEKAAKDPDGEVAARARSLLRILDLREALSPELRKKYPGIEEKLDTDPQLATRIVLDLASRIERSTEEGDDPVDPFPRSDLRLLAGPAIRGVKGEELATVCYKLHERAITEGVPELLPFLSSADPVVRGIAASNLGYHRHRPAIPGLFKLLEDPWGNNRPIAAEALLRLDAREILPGLREQLKSANPDVQDRAGEMLGEFGDRESIPALLALCRESKPAPWGPLEALVKMEVAEAAPFIVVRLRDETPGERESALLLLVRLRAREAVPILRSQLEKDGGDYGRAWCIQSLGEIGDPAAAPDIRPYLKHSDPSLSGNAMFALAAMGQKDQMPEILRALKDQDSNRRWFAVRALGLLRSREHVNEIIAQLDSRDVELRWASIDALGRIGAPEALPALRKAAASPLKADRDHALKAIQAIESPPRK